MFIKKFSCMFSRNKSSLNFHAPISVDMFFITGRAEIYPYLNTKDSPIVGSHFGGTNLRKTLVFGHWNQDLGGIRAENYLQRVDTSIKSEKQMQIEWKIKWKNHRMLQVRNSGLQDFRNHAIKKISDPGVV